MDTDPPRRISFVAATAEIQDFAYQTQSQEIAVKQSTVGRPASMSSKKKEKERDRLAGQTRKSRLEQTIFSLVQGIATGNEIPTYFALALIILEDMQLLHYSWRPGYTSRLRRMAREKVDRPFRRFLGLIVFIPSVLLCCLLLVDSDPRVASKNALAKAHGRTDLIAVLVKIVIVAVYAFADGSNAKLGVLVASTGILVREGITKQPYYSEPIQYLRNGLWMTAFLAAVLSLISDLTMSANPIPLVLLVIVIPIGLTSGGLLTRVYFQLTTRRVYARFRKTVEKAEQGSSGPGHVFAPLKREASIKDGGWAGVGRLVELVQSIDNLTTSRVKQDPPIFTAPHEVELACRFVRHAGPNTRALLLMREVLTAGGLQFPRDGYVLASTAIYLLAFAPVDEAAAGLALVFEEGSQYGGETNADRAQDILNTLANQQPPLDARYLAFLCEKTVDQSEKSKEANQSVLNVSSYAEMLSQEKYAKSIHVDALNELKSYWTRVRRGVTSAKDYEVFPSYLQGIASATVRCHDNYKKLIDRFPKSKTVRDHGTVDPIGAFSYFLHITELEASDMDDMQGRLESEDDLAEFQDGDHTGSPTATLRGGSIALAKAEMTKIKSEDSVAIDVNEDNNNRDVANDPHDQEELQQVVEIRTSLARKHASSHKAASSHGTSDTSESREARRAKVMRVEFARRVRAVPEMYDKRLRGLSFLCLAIVVLSLVLSNVTFGTLQTQVADFLLSTELGRYSMMMIQAVRLMTTFGSRGDSAGFQYWHDYLTDMDVKLFNAAKTYLVPRSGFQEGIFRVYVYDSIPHNVTGQQQVWPSTIYKNQFELAKSLQTSAEALLKHDISYFQSVLPTTDINARFLFDLATTGQETFISDVASQTTVLWVLLALSAVTIVSMGAFVFFPLFVETRRLQVRYFKIMKLVPKKAVDEILLILDEQIELMTDDGDKARPVTQENQASRSSFLSNAFVCAFTLRIFNDSVNIKFVSMVNFTNQRKFWTEAVKAYSYEVLIGDRTTWMFGRPEALLEDAITQYETIHQNSITGHGTVEIEPTTTIDLIYWLTEDLGCMIASCDPSVRNFNATIGFTYNETVSPLDNMIPDFLQRARAFLQINGMRATNNFYDDRLRFMQELSVDIQGGLFLIDTLVLQSYLPSGNAVAQTASVGVFVVCVVSFAGLYFFNFRKMAINRQQQMDALVNLIHMIPPAIVNSVPKIQRLIQSGGASIGDEES
ncbi:hypothetical protein HDU93_008302 [Gonapodya sp. JEL0774]|nr:hypothetical protein HDU93_008302 [Gonapodya sp. JEL0774]